MKLDDSRPQLKTPRSELLGRVRQRGTQLRRRRYALRFASILLPAGLAFAFAFYVVGLANPAADRGNFLDEAANSPPALPSSSPSQSPSTIAAPAPRIVRSAADDSKSDCLNSFDASCGPISWTPPLPKNRSMLIEWNRYDSTAKVGEPWTAEISIYDEVVPSQSVNFGDGSHTVFERVPPSGCRQGYGPWTLLAPGTKRSEPIEFWQPAVERGEISHTFSAPGTYTVTYHAESGVMNWRGVCLYDYLETSAKSVVVHVSPAEATSSPTTTP